MAPPQASPHMSQQRPKPIAPPTNPPCARYLRQARHEVEAPGGHPRRMYRLHGSVHIGCIVGAAAQRQQLLLERLQQ